MKLSNLLTVLALIVLAWLLLLIYTTSERTHDLELRVEALESAQPTRAPQSELPPKRGVVR